MTEQPVTTQDPIRAVPPPVPPPPEPTAQRDLHDAALYDNRELSWVEFNRRVLELAEQPDLPLLERVKFASIFASNLDEFFMIRVAGLHDQVDAGLSDPGADGRTPSQVIDEVHERVAELVRRHTRCVERELRPAMSEHGICIVSHDSISEAERERLAERFRRQTSPVRTPLAVGLGRPFPYISNLSLSLA